jgi:hypothetical protein|tara:strand:- start:978 stop:1211 length:234 start_codon:yes stop_codon:yes gene_type:complete
VSPKACRHGIISYKRATKSIDTETDNSVTPVPNTPAENPSDAGAAAECRKFARAILVKSCGAKERSENIKICLENCK